MYQNCAVPARGSGTVAGTCGHLRRPVRGYTKFVPCQRRTYRICVPCAGGNVGHLERPRLQHFRYGSAGRRRTQTCDSPASPSSPSSPLRPGRRLTYHRTDHQSLPHIPHSTFHTNSSVLRRFHPASTERLLKADSRLDESRVFVYQQRQTTVHAENDASFWLV